MVFKDSGETLVEPEVAIHRLTITLTNGNVKSLKHMCADLLRDAKDKNREVKRPVRCLPRPQKSLWEKLCGTRDCFQKRIHLHSPSEIVKQITSISTELEVKVEVATADA